MKVVSLFVATIFCFQTAYATTPTTSHKPVKISLRQTVLTVDTFRKLNGSDQIVYLNYVLNMLAVLEMSQDIQGYTYPEKKHSARIELEKFLKSLNLADDANAAGPTGSSGVVVVGTGSVTPEAESWITKTKHAMGEFFDSAYKAQITIPSLKSMVGSVMGPAIDAKKPAVPATAAPTAYPDSKDAFCIFGGYSSKYVKGATRMVCPAPKQAFSCEGEGQFACNTFGIQAPEIQAAACVPLQKLNDLTKRCVAAVTGALTKTTPFPVSKEGLQGLFDELKTAIGNYDKKVGGMENYDAYCTGKGKKDANEANGGHQAGECQAVTSLMTAFKETLGKKDVIQKAVAAIPATAPAAPAAVPAAAPAAAAAKATGAK